MKPCWVSFLTLAAWKLLKCWIPYNSLYPIILLRRTSHLLDPALVLCCCICNNKCSISKQHTFILLQVLTEGWARLQSGLGPHLRPDWGRICLQAHVVVGGIQFLADRGLSFSPGSASIAVSHPLCRRSPPWQLASSKPARRRSLSKMVIGVLCNVIRYT